MFALYLKFKFEVIKLKKKKNKKFFLSIIEELKF